MPKGITPVIAVILLLMITIGITGVGMVFFTQTTEAAAESGETALTQQLAQAGTQVRMEGVQNGDVYLRNTGTVDIPIGVLAFYVNNVFVTATGPSALSAGSIGTYVLDPAQVASLPATAEVRVAAGQSSHSLIGTIKNIILDTIIAMGDILPSAKWPGAVIAQGAGILFQDSGAQTIAIITPTGDMGIGTTTPASKLDVAGTGRFSGVRITGILSCSQALETDASGNVVCGTDQVGAGGGGGGGWTVLGANVHNNSLVTNISIGTSTGNLAKLHVFSPTSASSLLLENSQGRFYVSADPSGNAYLGPFTAGKFLALYSAGAERLRVDPTGNIGVGTTTPAAKLEIGGFALASTVKIGSGGVLTFNTPDYNNYALYGDTTTTVLNVPTGGSLGFRINNANQMVVTNTGNVGIGTPTPATKLHVAGGGLRVSNLVSCDTVDTDASGNFLCGTDSGGGGPSGNTGWTTTATTIYNNTPGVNVGINTNSPAYRLHVNGIVMSNFYFVPVGPANSPSYTFETDQNTGIFNPNGLDVLGFSTAGLERARIDGSGRVGINTSTPTATLQIDSSLSSGALRARSSTGTTAFFVNASAPIPGTVQWYDTVFLGGNTHVTGTLYLDSTIWMNGGSIWAQSGTAASPSHSFVFDTNTGMYLPSADTIGFVTGGTRRITIGNTGNVGINTATPTRTLHINDTIRIQPLSAAPATPALGDLYVDSDSGELCFYDGTAWAGLKAGGVCA